MQQFLGPLNLFDACVGYGCHSVIFSSTCATYGDHDNTILDENTQQRPTNAYGVSKRAVEEALKQISTSTKLKHVIFRYFNVTGADPVDEVGEFYQPGIYLALLILDAIGATRLHYSWVHIMKRQMIRVFVTMCKLVTFWRRAF